MRHVELRRVASRGSFDALCAVEAAEDAAEADMAMNEPGDSVAQGKSGPILATFPSAASVRRLPSLSRPRMHLPANAGGCSAAGEYP